MFIVRTEHSKNLFLRSKEGANGPTYQGAWWTREVLGVCQGNVGNTQGINHLDAVCLRNPGISLWFRAMLADSQDDKQLWM